MPRYEYKCKKCGESFEVVHGVHESVDSCEFCGGAVRRVFHPVGIVFKGSGFYATDAKKPESPAPGAPKEEGETAEKVAAEGNGGSKSKEKEKGPSDSAKSSS